MDSTSNKRYPVDSLYITIGIKLSQHIDLALLKWNTSVDKGVSFSECYTWDEAFGSIIRQLGNNECEQTLKVNKMSSISGIMAGLTKHNAAYYNTIFTNKLLTANNVFEAAMYLVVTLLTTEFTSIYTTQTMSQENISIIANTIKGAFNACAALILAALSAQSADQFLPFFATASQQECPPQNPVQKHAQDQMSNIIRRESAIYFKQPSEVGLKAYMSAIRRSIKNEFKARASRIDFSMCKKFTDPWYSDEIRLTQQIKANNSSKSGTPVFEYIKNTAKLDNKVNMAGMNNDQYINSLKDVATQLINRYNSGMYANNPHDANMALGYIKCCLEKVNELQGVKVNNMMGNMSQMSTMSPMMGVNGLPQPGQLNLNQMLGPSGAANLNQMLGQNFTMPNLGPTGLPNQVDINALLGHNNQMPGMMGNMNPMMNGMSTMTPMNPMMNNMTPMNNVNPMMNGMNTMPGQMTPMMNGMNGMNNMTPMNTGLNQIFPQPGNNGLNGMFGANTNGFNSMGQMNPMMNNTSFKL